MFVPISRHISSSCLRKGTILPRPADNASLAAQICRYRKISSRKPPNMHYLQQQQLAPGWGSNGEQQAGIRTSLWNGVNSCQGDLINHLKRAGHLRSPRVEQAMRAVDRRHFINPEYATQLDAYLDRPLPVGFGQTISAPHMHAICLELLERLLRPGSSVLDVGSGSGYMTAAMALLVGPTGHVVGVDKVVELVQASLASVAVSNPELLGFNRQPPLLPDHHQQQQQEQQEEGQEGTVSGDGQPRVTIVHGNALADVAGCQGPFDAIHVGAAADELHQELLDRLKPGGRMIIPVGPRYSSQVLMVVDKDAQGHVLKQTLMDVGYVPLTRPAEAENGYSSAVD